MYEQALTQKASAIYWGICFHQSGGTIRSRSVFQLGTSMLQTGSTFSLISAKGLFKPLDRESARWI